MELNKILRLLFVYFFSFTFFSCKGHTEKEDTIINDIESVQVQEKFTNKKETKSINQNQLVDFIKNFYSIYLSYLNDDVDTYNSSKYLSKDFIKYLNSLDYDGIIFAQDYEKFDLEKLKVSKTSADMIYKVEFVNMEVYEKTVFAKVKLINGSYKITNLTEDFNGASKGLVLPEFMTDEYYFESLSYYIEPTGESKTGIVFKVEEDFEGRGIIFSKNQAFGDYFEYLCTKKNTKRGLEIYHKKNIGLEEHEYKGDTSKPLITIYKKGEDFYARSILIENGKEVKLKEGF